MLQSLVDAILSTLDGKECRTEFADCRDMLRQSSLRRATGREMEWR